MNRKRSGTALAVLAAVALIVALLALSQLDVVALAQEGTPTPEPAPGATRVLEADGAVMVYVPAGEFLMGSPVFEGQSTQWPQHIVYLDGFWVDRVEVTNHQFQLFVEATGYRTLAETAGFAGVTAPAWRVAKGVQGADWRHPEGPNSGIADRMDHPVVQIGRDDAQAYCQWAGGHLPTEAEWEKVCRGTDARRYPWGNQDLSCEYAVFSDSSGPGCGRGWESWPVGSKPKGASPYGALDMAGNASEWVADLFGPDYYAHSPAANPHGPDSAIDAVARGGSWRDEAVWRVHGCAVRGEGTDLHDRNNASGFRCVVPASTVTAPAVSAATPVSLSSAGRVLLVGDSASWFLDRYLPRLAATGDPPLDILSKGLATAGATLVAQSKVLKYPVQEAASGNWDVVVLEQDLDSSWRGAARFCDDARTLDRDIKAAGAETVLFMPWDNAAIAPPTLQEAADLYTQCAADLGVKVAPVGLAFERAAAERPDLSLYIADGTHANQRGLYLALSVLYATLFDRSPVGLTYRMDDVAPTTLEYALWGLGKDKNWQITDDEAGFLRRIAWETVLEYQARQ